MSFVKGVVTGMMVGAAITSLKNDYFMDLFKKSKKEMRRFRRRLAK